MKKVLILNGSISEAPIIEEAKRLGFYVITSGNMPELYAHKLADEYIQADYSDKEAVLKIVKDNNIDGIITCANDFGTITASYVAEKLGLLGHDTYANAMLLHQKDQFKEYIQKKGYPCPYSVGFDNEDKAMEFIENTEYPIIVKATDLTGGKGILKAENIEEAKYAVKNAFDRSRIKHIVVEPYIVGDQQSIVVFIKDKKIISSATCDVFSPINPYLIQSELLPGWHEKEMKEILHPIIEEICEDLCLVDGVLTVQYIIKDGIPYIIELMRRTLGNQFLTGVVSVTGFPWEEAVVKSETGMSLDDIKVKKPRALMAGQTGIMADREGIVKSYSIDPELQKHIYQKIELRGVGSAIEDHMSERIAHIFYAYDSHEEAYNVVSNINDKFNIEIS